MKKLITKLIFAILFPMISLMVVNTAFASNCYPNNGLVPLQGTGIWVTPGSSTTVPYNNTQISPYSTYSPYSPYSGTGAIGNQSFRYQSAYPTSYPTIQPQATVPQVISTTPNTVPPPLTFSQEFLSRVNALGLKPLPGNVIWVSP